MVERGALYVVGSHKFSTVCLYHERLPGEVGAKRRRVDGDLHILLFTPLSSPPSRPYYRAAQSVCDEGGPRVLQNSGGVDRAVLTTA